MHKIWNLLLQNPDFWDAVNKHMFCDLRLVCREFRSIVPVREAILHIFKNKTIKMANLFRILPLSVNDMLKVRSPVNFIQAFKLAERKCGGFENCLAIMQQRGVDLWHMESIRRAEVRKEMDGLLHSNGMLSLKNNPVYESAIIRGVLQVAVWRCEYVYMPKDGRDSVCKIAGFFHNSEYEVLLSKLRIAMGHWYKGIHSDVRSIMAALLVARNEGVTERVHVQISDRTLVVGVISFLRWKDYIEANG